MLRKTAAFNFWDSSSSAKEFQSIEWLTSQIGVRCFSLTAIGQVRIAFFVQFDRQLVFFLLEKAGSFVFHQFSLCQTLFGVQFPRLWLLLEIEKSNSILNRGVWWNVKFLTSRGAKCMFWFDDESATTGCEILSLI